MLKNVELRKLPAGTLSAIVDILEINNDWRKVMSIIPKDLNGDRSQHKYNIEHMRLIEESARATNQKCAEILLDEWGTSGRARPTLAALRDVVVAAGVYRAGDEIAALLQEAPPPRPGGGPEQQISTNVTEMLNQSLQQHLSTARAVTVETNNYNKNQYQDQSTEPIRSSYYGIQSVRTEELPNIINVQLYNGKSTEQLASHSDFIKFSSALALNPTSASNQLKVNQEVSKGYSQMSTKVVTSDYVNQYNHEELYRNINVAHNVPTPHRQPSPNIEIDNTIFLDTNLIHFRYCDLQAMTNDFSENPANMPNPGVPGKIGSGGFGDVFLGHHPAAGALAIKRTNQHLLRFYNPDIIAKVFNSEVKYLSQFRHANILPILGYSIDGPFPCIICEYIPGGSLQQKIAERVLNERHRLGIMLGTAEGLRYLHTSNKQAPSTVNGELNRVVDSDSQQTTNNFMHGDVKSANILLTNDYQPKLCDFGLAKQYEATFKVSSPMGTSAYMSPEGREGAITQKLDIYSYGVVLLELLTGLRPLVVVNGEKINIKMYVDETCAENNGISQLLDSTVQWTKASDVYTLSQRCLLEDRRNRPNMNEICTILRDIYNN